MDPKVALWVKLAIGGGALVAFTVLAAVGRIDADRFTAAVERVAMVLIGGTAVLGGAGAIGGAIAGDGSGSLSVAARRMRRLGATVRPVVAIEGEEPAPIIISSAPGK